MLCIELAKEYRVGCSEFIIQRSLVKVLSLQRIDLLSTFKGDRASWIFPERIFFLSINL